LLQLKVLLKSPGLLQAFEKLANWALLSCLSDDSDMHIFVFKGYSLHDGNEV